MLSHVVSHVVPVHACNFGCCPVGAFQNAGPKAQMFGLGDATEIDPDELWDILSAT